MNNAELIQTLNYDDLLSIGEMLCIALRSPSDIDDLGDMSAGWLPDDVFEYVKGLTDYERLKLIQLIINTLIHEAEKPVAQGFQTLLPLSVE
jgi:hypothetical protein